MYFKESFTCSIFVASQSIIFPEYLTLIESNSLNGSTTILAYSLLNHPFDSKNATFTITNGGIYGSMLSTPILNPPQSGVLGMHNIVERPIAVNG